MPAENTEILDYIASSGEALETSRKFAALIDSEGQKVAALIPVRTQAMKAAGLIQENEVAKCAEILGTHEGALAVLDNVLQIRSKEKQAAAQELEMARQGSPVEKQANGQSTAPGACRLVKRADTHFPGQRLGENEFAESDFALMRGLNIPLPVGLG